MGLSDRGTGNGRREWLDGLGLLALAVGVFVPALVRGRIPCFMDTVAQFYPLRFHAARLLHEGQWPLWNRTMFCGVPLLANPQWGLLYPLNWPFLAWPGPFWFTASYPVHFAIGAWGIYLLVGRMGGGRLGAWAGALAFLLNSLTLGRIAFGAHHLALAWLPWGWLAVEGMAASGGFALGVCGAALVIALQLVSGAPQIAFYALLSYAALAVLMAGKREDGVSDEDGASAGALEEKNRLKAALRTEDRLKAGLRTGNRLAAGRRAVLRRVGGVGLAGLIGAALAAPQILPTLDFLGECGRGGGLSLQAILQGTLGTRGLVHAFLGGSGWPEEAESTAYFGAGWIFLAFLAIALRPRAAAPYGALFAGCLLFCHGSLAPWLYRLFPGYAHFHDPKRVLTIAAAALSVLAGLGASAAFDPGATERCGARRLWLSFAGAVAAAVALQAFSSWPVRQAFAAVAPAFGWFGWPFGQAEEAWRWIGPWAPMGVAAVGAGTAWIRPAWRRDAALAAVAGLSIQLWLFSAARSDLKMEPAGRFFSAERGRAFPRSGRFFAYDPTLQYSYDYAALAERLFPNAAAYYGMEDAQGYDAFQLKCHRQTLDALNAGGLQLYPSHFGLITRLDSPKVAQMGVAYATGPTDLPAIIRALQEERGNGGALYDPDKAIRLGEEIWLPLRNPRPLVSLWPRGQWGDSFAAPSLDSGREALILDADQPRRAFAWPEGCGKGRIVSTTVSANRVEIEAEAPPGGAFLLLRDAYASGWRAAVDGQPAAIVRAEGMFRATALPAGRHTVEFFYRAPGLVSGLEIAGFGLAALLAAAMMGIPIPVFRHGIRDP